MYLQEVQLPQDEILRIVPGTSASNLETLISLYLGWGSSFLVLLDSDKEGIKQKKRYIDLFGNELENKIITYIDINSSWINYKMENLFENDEKERVIQYLYPSNEPQIYSKSVFNRSLQELYFQKKQYPFSDKTILNFKNLISILARSLMNQSLNKGS